MQKYISALCFLFMLSACKKDPDVFKDGSSGKISMLFESPVSLKANGTYASMDGNYIVVVEVTNTGANGYSRLYVSRNAGQSWQTQGIPMHPENDIHITKSGHIYFSRGNTRLLYDLNAAREVPIDYPGSISQWDDFVLGNDDMIYLARHSDAEKAFRHLSQSTWTDFTLSGIYCGQDIATGGGAFYDPSLHQLHIHDPANHMVRTHEININASQVSQGPYQPNRPPRYRYSGSNHLAIAYTKGVAVQNLITNEVNYTNWEGDYEGHYLNPVSVSIDSEGAVFASLNYYQKNETFKVANRTLEKLASYARTAPVSRGKYTYYLGTLRLIRQSQNQHDEFETSYIDLDNPEWAAIRSARVVNNKKYALLSIASPITALHLYNESNGRFEQVNEIVGKYDYIYSDGSNVFVFGEDNTAYSPDNGGTWQIHENTLTGVVKSMSYVLKSGQTYYGLATENYSYNNLSTGKREDRHKLSTYSSPDGINWTEIASTGENSGKAPEAMTADGRMMFTSSGSGELVFSVYSQDYGLTWETNDDHVPFFNAQNDNSIFGLYGGLNNIRLVTYDNNFNVMSDVNIENNTEAETLYSVQNVHVADQTGNAYFITWKYFMNLQ